MNVNAHNLDTIQKTEHYFDCQRSRQDAGTQLLLPWSVVTSRLGLTRSVEDMLRNDPRPCPNRNGCFIDAAGRVYESQDGQLVECERRTMGHKKRVFCDFDKGSFKLWCLNEVYCAFFGKKPKDGKIEPLDGDHQNTRLDNCLIVVNPQQPANGHCRPQSRAFIVI